jgi:hypothetical protein
MLAGRKEDTFSPKHARELSERAPQVGNMMENLSGVDNVDALIRERQGFAKFAHNLNR